MKALRDTLTVTWNEILLILKDKGSLGILFVLPLVLTTIYGGMNQQFAGENEASILLNICLANEDGDLYGDQVSAALREISVLHVEEHGRAAEAQACVAEGKAIAAVVLPEALTERIGAYEPVSLEVLVDPGEPEAASIVTGIMNQVVDELTVWGEVQHGVHTVLEESGLLAGASTEVGRAAEAQSLGAVMTTLNRMRRSPAVAVASETMAGGEVRSGIEQFFALMFPGITVMFVFFIVGMSGSALLRERETGTLRRLLSAPVSPAAVIGGKALAYALLACAQVVVLFGVGRVAFGMPLGDSPAGLVVLTLLLGLVAATFGLMVASLARNAGQADNIGTLLAFLMAGLGGCIAISSTPATRQPGIMSILSRLTPQGNALEGYYSLMADNAGLGGIGPELLALAGFLALFVVVAAWRFRYEG